MVGLLLGVELVDAQVLEADEGASGVVENGFEPHQLAIVGREGSMGSLGKVDEAADQRGEAAVALRHLAQLQ